MIRRILFILVAVGLLLAAGIQLVPLGRQHSNPPVTGEPAWPNPASRALAVRACYDCHSNETIWPWYSNVAPISWVLQNHVEEARSRLNFSVWNRPQRESREAAEAVLEGEMPPSYYRWMHRSANLTSAEKERLTQALAALH